LEYSVLTNLLLLCCVFDIIFTPPTLVILLFYCNFRNVILAGRF
jgi:hypothetical protein